MARYLYAYKLTEQTQNNLFYTNNGDLDLESVNDELNNNLVNIQDGKPISEGFYMINELNMGDVESIEAICIVKSSLGNYSEARFENEIFTSVTTKHQYFTKAKIFLTKSFDFIMMFDSSNEERGKSGVNNQIQALNLGIKSFQINDSLIRNLQKKYTWTAATFNKIVKRGDSTRRVSFDIDPANTTDGSFVQQEYSEHGDLSHLKFVVPFNDQSTDKLITVKLYADKNRIIIDEEEFSSMDTFNDFVLYLMGILNKNL